MPTYRYECPDGHQFERVCTIADMESFEGGRMACDCGRRLLRVLAMGRPVVFRAGYYEHVSADGAHCSNMGELKRAARDGGTYSQYAEDLGGLFRAKEGRWI